MEVKEEALKLADQLDGLNSCEPVIIKACEGMIRRLVEELDKQGSSIWDSTRRVYENCQCDSCRRKTAPQTKPLSDEEMKELINNFPIIFSPQDLLTFGRAIEERHGIK